MPKLIEGYAARIRVPDGDRDILIFDDVLPGFFIRKFESGKASYGVKYNVGAQQRRLSLGAVVPGVLAERRKNGRRHPGACTPWPGRGRPRRSRPPASRSLRSASRGLEYLAARKVNCGQRATRRRSAILSALWLPLHEHDIEHHHAPAHRFDRR